MSKYIENNIHISYNNHQGGILMKLQKLYSYTRKAIDDYQMIAEGDHIAVGLSGGKDSLALLYALVGLKQFYPNKFTLTAISVDLGINTIDYSRVETLCEQLKIPFIVVPTKIMDIAINKNNEAQKNRKTPCSLCAKMRKGAFNIKAKEVGCNKVALAHHKDDLIETMLMSLIFEGRFHTFSPVTYLEDTELIVIRPLIYVSEADIKGFRNKYELPVIKNPCPYDGNTKREYVKQLVSKLEYENRGSKERMMHAILSGHLESFPPIIKSSTERNME